MADFKVGNTKYLVMSSKVVTPSIIINNLGYIPLFQGSNGGTVDYQRYRYTLGALCVGNYRAAVSRSFINHNPSVTVSASSTYIANGTTVRVTATAADPDGDSLTYKWNTGATTSYIDVSASNTTNSYSCTVSDPYGGTATSNTVSVQWYNPNHAPTITSLWVENGGHVTSSTTGLVHLHARVNDVDGNLNYLEIYTKNGSNSWSQLFTIRYAFNTWAGIVAANFPSGYWYQENGGSEWTTVRWKKIQLGEYGNKYWYKVIAYDTYKATASAEMYLTKIDNKIILNYRAVRVTADETYHKRNNYHTEGLLSGNGLANRPKLRVCGYLGRKTPDYKYPRNRSISPSLSSDEYLYPHEYGSDTSSSSPYSAILYIMEYSRTHTISSTSEPATAHQGQGVTETETVASYKLIKTVSVTATTSWKEMVLSL